MSPKHAHKVKSDSPATHISSTAKRTAQTSDVVTLQRATDNPQSLSPQNILQLQKSVGNQAVLQLLKQREQATAPANAPIQRTVATAAAALFGEGVKKVMPAHMRDKEFIKAHGIKSSELSAVQTELVTLWNDGPPRARVKSAAQALFAKGIGTVKEKDLPKAFCTEHIVSTSDLVLIQEALTDRWRAAPGVGAAAAKTFLEKLLPHDSSGVTLERNTVTPNIIAVLDNDQMKHQPAEHPIGTREASGTKFKSTNASPAWHQENTLVHMADWAAGLGVMTVGQKKEHGQGAPVDGIHYEGFCVFAGGKKYVLFHCYPHRESDLAQ